MNYRSKIIAGAAIVAAIVALVQRTGIAPFPHGADDFLGGFAVGAGIAAVVAWIGSRA